MPCKHTLVNASFIQTEDPVDLVHLHMQIPCFQCFDSFILFDFTPYDEEIFASLVWPQLPRLPQECIQAPTPLMKLIAIWTKHKRLVSDSQQNLFHTSCSPP